MMGALGEIIFIHSLRSTVLINLTQFNQLPRYYHINYYAIARIFSCRFSL
nr:MAG TPA: hypothetical protein [Caudoviricetes sp.]